MTASNLGLEATAGNLGVDALRVEGADLGVAGAEADLGVEA
jgi:hypothetical protein